MDNNKKVEMIAKELSRYNRAVTRVAKSEKTQEGYWNKKKDLAVDSMGEIDAIVFNYWSKG